MLAAQMFIFQGVMAVDQHLPYYGSRTLFDHYRGMRLDIEDMSYEVASIPSFFPCVYFSFSIKFIYKKHMHE